MKKLLTLLVFLCSLSAFAQDVIVKKDGSTVVCRVVELNASQIIYKAWTDLNGDSRVMSRSDASSINYQDGRKENLGEAKNQYAPNNQNDGVQGFNDVELLRIDARISHKDANAYTKKAKRLRRIGAIGGAVLIGIGGIIMLSSNTYTDPSDERREQSIGHGAICMGVGVVGAATCFILAHNNQKIAKKIQAISLYQQDFKFKNGSSLTPSFDLLKDQALNHQTIGIGLHYNF